jgi:long-chain-fatty-acid--CoA ligase ACSBG
MVTRSKVYFARPDALSGSLVETLRTVKPTIFFGVPRIFEKFEEKIKLAVDSSSILKRRIIKWAQKIGQKTVERRFKGEKPGMLYSLANYLVFSRVRAALGFGDTKIVAFGAAPMKRSTIDFFKSLNIPLFNNYGMSETTGPQFLNMGEKDVDLYSAGLTLKGTDVKIDNPDRDGIGEIFFRGRNRFMGYFKDIEATNQTIDKNGYIHSGDAGFLNIKNNLVITGRIKELIVTAGGENIAPIPIEENLKDICKLISNVVIIGDNRPYLVALITLKSDSSGNISENDDNGGLTTPSLEILRMIDPNIYSGSSFNVIDVVNDDKVKKYIQAAIDKVNERAVSRAQVIRKWHILPNDFTIESGELTHTHKVKRKYIDQKYAKYIEALYANYKF